MSANSITPRKTTRLRFLKEVYWRLGVLIVLALYNGLQLISNVLAWTTSPETQQRYQFIKMVQAWSLRTWIIGLLVLIIIITFEGAYRFVRRLETGFGGRLDNCESAVQSLKEELEPKLSILFEPTFPYLDLTQSGFHEVRIGVRNISGKELSRVKVQLDDLRDGPKVYDSLLLSLTRNKHLYEYPYIQEFFLNPGETEYLDLAMWYPENSTGTFYGSGPDINEGETFEFTITALGSEGKPFRQRASLTLNTSPPWFTFSLKGTGA